MINETTFNYADPGPVSKKLDTVKDLFLALIDCVIINGNPGTREAAEIDFALYNAIDEKDVWWQSKESGKVIDDLWEVCEEFSPTGHWFGIHTIENKIVLGFWAYEDFAHEDPDSVLAYQE